MPPRAKIPTMPTDYEKLGAFYLGRRHDVAAGATTDDLILYDAKDLTTHAVIIGMTGSGKTGLGIGLLEEAAIDGVPVIAIDPKGDLGNLLLTFPDLAPTDFEPWINLQDAEASGGTPIEYATKQAALWKEGLASWDQAPDRIARLRDAANFCLWTPGSSAGRPISVLRSFRCPNETLRTDRDLYRERVQATATGLLALVGVDADPLTSREHILLANVLQHTWDAGKDLDVASLIGLIQQPPMTKIGVLDLDTFFPSKDRFALAMRLNSLLAAPGFESWMEGPPLDAGNLLYTESGRPRVSVVSIAHLGEAERMFFVSMLLNEVIAWMRAQSGTGSLRAILYMDEVFGYLPPVANPPAKQLFLTLLKQARAYGLGLVLATQNPVDLDYKALSNAGTWFIGRLQTERDKLRVMEGLEGAGAGGSFDKGAMERTLAGLGKRIFLLHNVHESAPVTFESRWVMSYLSGPLTRDHIRRLTEQSKPGDDPTELQQSQANAGPSGRGIAMRPVLSPDIQQVFVPISRSAPPTYAPRIVAVADVGYRDTKREVDETRRVTRIVEVRDGPLPVDWDRAELLDWEPEDLEKAPVEDAAWQEPPAALGKTKSLDRWEKLFARWVCTSMPLTLYGYKPLRLTSLPEETERDFRIRLQQAAREARDAEIEKLRGRYDGKLQTLENRLLRARQAVERESAQVSQQKMSAMVSAGTALLGALLGRKRVSVTSASRLGTAVRGMGRVGKERGDVARATETAASVEEQMQALDAELRQEIDASERGLDPHTVELDEVTVKPKTTDVQVRLIAVLWIPE